MERKTEKYEDERMDEDKMRKKEKRRRRNERERVCVLNSGFAHVPVL